MKTYKYGPEVRAYFAKQKRDYRSRKNKQKAEAATIGPETASANNTPETTTQVIKEVSVR